MASELDFVKLSNLFAQSKSKAIEEMKKIAKAHNKEMRAHHKKAYDRRVARARRQTSSDKNPTKKSDPKTAVASGPCTTYLCSVQVNLSRLKTRVRKNFNKNSASSDASFRDAFYTHYLNKLRLTAKECSLVRTHRSNQVEQAGGSVVSIKGDLYVKKARSLLTYVLQTRSDPFEAVIALAILTGRRSSEIIKTISVHAPRYSDSNNPRKSHPQYWASMRGFLKHKPGTRIRRDIPLLGSRNLIVQGLKYVREQLPSKNVQECNSKYSTQINRRVKVLCGELKTLHTARRLYALMCHHYFKNDINPGEIMSLPRVVSYALGHTNLSKTSLTYMNIDLDTSSLGGLDFATVG